MDLRLLQNDPDITVVRRWSAMDGKVGYIIYEKSGRYFYATTWEIDDAPHEIFFNRASGDFVFKNGFRWNSRSRRYEYFELQEDPFGKNSSSGSPGE